MAYLNNGFGQAQVVRKRLALRTLRVLAAGVEVYLQVLQLIRAEFGSFPFADVRWDRPKCKG